jgi:hypothetical protein
MPTSLVAPFVYFFAIIPAKAGTQRLCSDSQAAEAWLFRKEPELLG